MHPPAPSAEAHPPAAMTPAHAPVPIDLALQGGGSHGAFTWGVLDRLLEDGRLSFPGISGASAGALNAGVMATGFARGGRDGARAALTAFWTDVGQQGQAFSPFSMTRTRARRDQFNFDKLPGYQWLNLFFRTFSPYEFNPLNLNPLREIVRRHIDIDALHGSDIQLFVAATSVHSGQARIFTGKDLSTEAFMASACLPFVFQAVEIDGEPYWDGGYTGNPALFPLIYDTAALDVLLVKINPLHRPGTPTRSVEILDRVNEITFNASLISELRAIEFVTRLLEQERLDPSRYKKLRLHMIADEDGLAPFNGSSKFNTDPNFLNQLFQLGQAAAGRWLGHHLRDVGQRSSLNLAETFLPKPKTRRSTASRA